MARGHAHARALLKYQVSVRILRYWYKNVTGAAAVVYFKLGSEQYVAFLGSAIRNHARLSYCAMN